MTEPSPSDLPRSKPSTLTAETQKKKKNSRKKSDVKNVEQHQHVETKAPADNKLDGYADVINYINRLEHDVAIAKKQLKNQRQNFRKAISALAQHFDNQGISSDIIANFIKSLGKREAQVESLEESYEKFYSEHKYHIVQDPKNLVAKPQPKPKNKFSIETEAQNPTENNPEVPKLAKENSPNKEAEAEPQNTDKKKKKSTKEAKEKVTNGETNNNEEAPKKRKYQKKPKPSDEEDKKAAGSSPPEIQEIPSLTPGKDSAKKSAPRNKDTLRSYEEIPQLKQAADMKENKPRGDPYGDMGRYFNQLGIDPMSLMNMCMPMGMNMGNQEYYNKMMQELMKANVMQNMLNMDQSRQDVFNQYQRNLK